MSLYREPGRRGRATWLVVVAALVVGVVAGLVLGRATASSPSLADQVGEVQEHARTVVDGFELVRTHYPRDRGAARGQARRAQEEFADARSDLAALDPAAAAAAAAAVAEAARTTNRDASPAAVDAAARRAVAAVRAAARLGR
jgi:uncharacterized membrane-anchored protein YhcB (DUF1043 family)